MDNQTLKKAIITGGWILCPSCHGRQFPRGKCKRIDSLVYQCRYSRGENKHFMLIDFDYQNECEKESDLVHVEGYNE